MCTSNSRKVTNFVFADGTVRPANAYISGDVTIDELSTAVANHRRDNATKTYGINLYNAANAPFCLGASAHSSVDAARRSASPGSYLSSFGLTVNADGSIRTAGSSSAAAYTRYAIWTGSKFRKPSFSSAYEARSNARSGDRVVAIGVSGTRVVYVAGV